VKSTFFDLYARAAERTEEMARVGVKHYDRFALGREIQRHLELLGRHVYTRLSADPQAPLGQDPEVLRRLDQIRALEAEREAREAEIREIRGRRTPGGGEDSGPRR
jgi:hypothetical protein